MREGLEIQQTGVAPPLCVTSLDAQFTLHFIEALTVHIGLHGIPYGQEMACLVDSVVVLVAQLVPEGATALHLVVPRHVVEPGQQVFRTGVDVVIQTAELFGILLDIGRTIQRAVEAQSDAVGLVIVGRRPVGTHSTWGIPRFRSVVMGTGKDVVNAQRHHIADASLAAVQHDA